MSRFSLFLSILFCSVLCLITSINAKADETTTTVVTPVATPEGAGQQTTTTVVNNGTVERKTIVTTVPAAKEVIAAPTGYASCNTIAAGWYNDTWVPAHQVCTYTASTEGVAWVEGYWACTKYTGGDCTNWDWKAGHWVKTLVNY